MASNIVHVSWEGPFDLEEVIDNKVDDNKDCGIYQIYGNHPVYGLNSLIYIGIATDQSFSERFKVHERTWLMEKDYVPIKVYLGDVYRQNAEEYRKEHDFTENGEWKENVELCEKLLIYALGPSYNLRNKQSINELELRELLILNWNSYGALPPEVSGDRWTYKYGRK